MDGSEYVKGVLDQYSERERDIARWITASCSLVSVIAGLVGFLFYYILDRRLFRHRLLFILIFYDFFKSFVLLVYPLHVIRVAQDYNDLRVCDTAGFLLSMFIEGADFTVFFLALHSALVVFNSKTYLGKNEGLYRYRYAVYVFLGVLPAVVASLAFIQGREAYIPDIAWCSLPNRPIWYRLVLSWIPRTLILLSVFSLYIAVYIYVKKEYAGVADSIYQGEKVSWKTRMKSSVSNVFSFSSRMSKQDMSWQSESTLDSKRGDAELSVDWTIRQSSWQEVQLRRYLIERQIKQIFLYPICYGLIWLFPFVIQCHRLVREETYHYEFWMTCVQGVTIPLTCTVDVIIFAIRETPLKSRKSKRLRSSTIGPLKVKLAFNTNIFSTEHTTHCPDSQEESSDSGFECIDDKPQIRKSSDIVDLKEFLNQAQ